MLMIYYNEMYKMWFYSNNDININIDNNNIRVNVRFEFVL